ncbi:hypothetical protein HH308_01390 [Gordonia sp. TBRC 11910]|uniref:Uncharacterized protein n=1 Tax=Gordonia asplenii TaxID=2725283 RepID=A0A848KWM9_9ACTN|nr:hypothetical protein [Gordonia asplenii]NMN99867.1 hypothetical protein [Gordonia asplenii]
MKVPSTVTGLWGEAIVVQDLRNQGWRVDWDGGLTRGRDLRATLGDRTVHVQVKTTTSGDGRIAWAADGARARDWSASVEIEGAQAIYALVYLPDAADVDFDLESGVMTIQLPRNHKVAFVPAEQFADDVDVARAEYGSRVRKVRGRNGEAVGTPLSPDGLRYPVCAFDYDFGRAL